MARKLSGWGINNRPFSPSEYANSHLKDGSGQSYNAYLKEYARQNISKTGSRKKSTRKTPKSRSSFPGLPF